MRKVDGHRALASLCRHLEGQEHGIELDTDFFLVMLDAGRRAISEVLANNSWQSWPVDGSTMAVEEVAGTGSVGLDFGVSTATEDSIREAEWIAEFESWMEAQIV